MGRGQLGLAYRLRSPLIDKNNPAEVLSKVRRQHSQYGSPCEQRSTPGSTLNSHDTASCNTNQENSESGYESGYRARQIQDHRACYGSNQASGRTSRAAATE